MTAESRWLDDLPVIGSLPPDQAAEKLRELEDYDGARELEMEAAASPSTFVGLPGIRARRQRAYMHTSHIIGFLPASGAGSHDLRLRQPATIDPDLSMKNGRVRLTLTGFRAADYPGRGAHTVLFSFSAQNILPSSGEMAHFSTKCRVAEGEEAAVLGRPLFVGLNVSTEGLFLQAATVNVGNEKDEQLLRFLDGEVFKAGLALATTVQPVVGQFSAIAIALTKSIAQRHQNVPVQTIELSLDFTNILPGARLAEGSYFIVQIPQPLIAVWRWDDWEYEPANGRVVSASDHSQLLPYNYMILSVSRYNER